MMIEEKAEKKNTRPLGRCRAYRPETGVCTCELYTFRRNVGAWPTCECGHSDGIHREPETL